MFLLFFLLKIILDCILFKCCIILRLLYVLYVPNWPQATVDYLHTYSLTYLLAILLLGKKVSPESFSEPEIIMSGPETIIFFCYHGHGPLQVQDFNHNIIIYVIINKKILDHKNCYKLIMLNWWCHRDASQNTIIFLHLKYLHTCTTTTKIDVLLGHFDHWLTTCISVKYKIHGNIYTKIHENILKHLLCDHLFHCLWFLHVFYQQ